MWTMVCCAMYCETIYMTRWSICYGTWSDFSPKIMFLESLKHTHKKCQILTNKSVKNMTQTLLAITLQRILLNRVKEENVKIVHNQKVILRMSYNYSYVFVCIKLQINGSIQVIFVVLFTLWLKSLVKINYVPFKTPVLILPLT